MADRSDPFRREWARLVDEIVVGKRRLRSVVLGATSEPLIACGLPRATLEMSAAKIARCHRDHPEIDRATWHALPALIDDPRAVFPSTRRDGSVIAVLVLTDARGLPIVVPITAGTDGAPNIVLTIFAKEAGWNWVETQLRRARQDNLAVYVKDGFAASVPQPEAETSSSPGPIPADGTTKPVRKILTVVQPVKRRNA